MKIVGVNYSQNNLLRVVPVKIPNYDSILNGVIDDGSTLSFISRRRRNELPKLKSRIISCLISGLNGQEQNINNEEIILPIYDITGRIHTIEVIVVDEINPNISLPDLNNLRKKFPELKSVSFPNLPQQPVEILFGQNAPEVLVARKADLFLGKGHPNVRFTLLGPALGYSEKMTPKIQLLMAKSQQNENVVTQNLDAQAASVDLCLNPDDNFADEIEIARLIQKLINNEDTSISINKRIQSPQNEELEALMRKNFRRTKDGHMEMPLPWKKGEFPLKCNFRECVKFDLAQRTKIVSKNPEYWTHCIGELEKQVQYGAARKLGPSDNYNEGFYHPITVVVKRTKTSTPIRMCLDASRLFKQEDGKKACFNDQLPVGTNLLNDIRDVLVLFRLYPVTLVTDITKMFFNIFVPENQRKYLRFVFNGVVYESFAFPFGLRISPYVASICLKLQAEQAFEAGEIDQATLAAVDRQVYMDDGCFSLEDEKQAIELANQLMKTFDQVHMNFNKVISCSKKVMMSIPENRRLSEVTFDDPLPESGTLGINYDANDDCLNLNPLDETITKITKSEIMRVAAKVYDPNNLLGIITINARKLTQLIFQIPKPNGKEIPFSEDLENFRETCPDLIEQIIQGYKECGEDLKQVHQIKIPRLLIENKPVASKKLIIFCDGSTVAYGAVAYLRVAYHDGNISVRLIKAAKKCTPIRRQTIPRIELMAALEGAKLAARLKKLIHPDETILFSDAIVVLFWIHKSDLHRFEDWVQTRLTQIHESTKSDVWRHVESALNPADLLSRGVKLNHIWQDGDLTEKGKFWFHGPGFLMDDIKVWPHHEREIQQILNLDEEAVIEESIKTFNNLLTTVEEKHHIEHMTKPVEYLPTISLNVYRQLENVMDNLKVCDIQWLHDQKEAVNKALAVKPLIDISRFSTVKRACRALNKVVDSAHTWFTKVCGREPVFQRYNMKECYQRIVQEVQAEGFHQDLSTASKTNMWPLKSLLTEVNALFDQNNILRANARLTNYAGIPIYERRPIILPDQHPFVKTLIHTFHVNIGHGGSVAELLSAIKRLFFFKKMRQHVRKYLNKCVLCRKKYNKPLEPHMAEFPNSMEQVTMFERISIDFFGPVAVIRGRKTEKYYVLVLVCIQTHALALELCEGLTTEQVLTAIQRFCLNHRVPNLIRSDNGKSFVTAKQILYPEVSMDKVNWEQIQNIFDTSQWTMTAPGSPENLAEAYVKLVKRRLDLDLSSRKFTRDQLSTLLTLAVNSVNNRPLTFLSEDINDPRPVTANILMKPMFHTSIGLKVNENTPIKYRRYYEEICQYAEEVSQRWTDEFAKELKKYPKWKTWQENVKVGDLVVVIESNPLKSRDWPLGIITKVFPDPRDNVVRKCHVKYKTQTDKQKQLGIYLRPVRNLIPLNLWHNLD